MSRIIVKNLPKGITANKLEEMFAAKGIITDLQLKYNKQGVFRQFAFIGYKTEEEAEAAKEYFHNTFVNTSKIKVEICTNLSDPNKPKPWKKPQSSDNIVADKKKEEKVDIKKAKKKKRDNIPKELKEDPEFKEFLGVHKDRKSNPTWGEDVDLDQSNSESNEDEENESEMEIKPSISPKKDSNSSNENNLPNISPQNNSSTSKQVKSYDDMYTVKLKNLPYQCKKNQIKKFFQSLKIVSLRMPPKSKGFAYVGFKTEKDLKQALNKNKGYLDGHCVNVIKYVRKADALDKFNSNGKSDDKELNEELLAETGRIFVRNLCYTVTEDEIEKHFVKYGPIAELHVPIDFSTKKSKGFAFITYMFAEHAVKAFTDLDGTIFQGRVLHLIPARPKKEYEAEGNENNFKKKKETEMKKQSSSSHNWNILFLGMNAVADAVSEKYNIQKSELLSGDSKKSVAVRMALAETEMVEKTRKFLVNNGVQLDAFSQPATERSKTVIVVKHLPAKTTAAEIEEMFGKHGTISRVLLPPTGMVALVEFENAAEAKTAFTKLAYRKFRYLPLFLEWAPVDGLKEPLSGAEEDDETEEKEEKETIDVKTTEDIKNDDDNLTTGTTIYVKNINFSTTQEAFEKHFKECGPVNYATISTKTDPKTGKLLSMGFGFVQFSKNDSAIYALQNLQQSILDGHALELKFANRSISSTPAVRRKKYEVKKQTSSKILVKNVPFQASENEVKALFKEFGTLASVRLPKKLGKAGEHRGFAFIEYDNMDDAQRAFDALCHSTHLFNRRLVLEWANTDSEDVSELRKRTASRYFEAGPKKKMKKSQLKEDIVVAAARNIKDDDDNEDE